MSTLDTLAAELAALNDNVMGRKWLLDLGATDDWIETKVRRRVLQTLFRGVYLHGAAEPTFASGCALR